MLFFLEACTQQKLILAMALHRELFVLMVIGNYRYFSRPAFVIGYIGSYSFRTACDKWMPWGVVDQ